MESELAKPGIVWIRNPYRSLEAPATPAQLIGMWSSARRGQPDDMLELGRQLLERDLHIRSVYQTRKRAVDRVPVHVIPASKSPADKMVADSVTEYVVERPEFRQLRKDLGGAIYQGYEVVEVVWDTGNPSRWIPHYAWRWPEFFGWDRETGTRLGLRTKDAPIWGEEIPDRKVICHKSTATTGHVFRRGLLFPLSSYHLFKSADIRQWISLGEIYGVPWRVAETEREVSEGDREEILDSLENLGEEAVVLLPPGIKLNLSDALSGKGQSDYHERFFRTMNQEISKGYLGQTMTTEDGSSRSQAEVHKEIADTIRDADIEDLDDTCMETVIRWYVDVNFGENVPTPMIMGSEKRPGDVAEVAKAIRDVSVAAGRTIPVAWRDVLQKLGLPPPEEGDVLLDGRTAGADGQPAGDGDEEDLP